MYDSKKVWYAVELDENDNDWGEGSFDFYDALKIARKLDAKYIAVIDGDVCAEVIDIERTRREEA